MEALLRWRHPAPRHGRPRGADPGRRAERGDAAADPPGDRRGGGRSSPSGPRPGLELRAAVNVSVRDLHTGEIADQIAERLARVRRTADAAPAGDHRGRADGRPAPGAGHPHPAATGSGSRSRWTTSAPDTLDAAPAPAAAGRGEDRPVVRPRHGRRRRRRGDRPLGHRAGRRARAAGGRRGGGGRAHLAAAARGRLRRRAGLVLRPADAGRGPGRLAGPVPADAPATRLPGAHRAAAEMPRPRCGADAAGRMPSHAARSPESGESGGPRRPRRGSSETRPVSARATTPPSPAGHGTTARR